VTFGRFARPALLALSVLGILSAPASAFDVVSCETTVPAREIAVLQADLECTGVGFDHPAVQLGSGATLGLNGHRINHPEVPGDLYGFGVFCPTGKCTINGPGEITGDLVGIEGPKPVVNDVSVHEALAGIIAVRLIRDQYGNVVAKRYGDLVATNVTLLADGSGVVARNVWANGLTVSQAEQLGIQARKIRGTAVTVTGNGWMGIAAEACDLDGLTATDNGSAAAVFGGGLEIYRGTARVRNATITRNRVFVDGGSVDGDVVAVRMPRLENVTCDHSVRLVALGQSTGSLGVCAGD